MRGPGATPVGPYLVVVVPAVRGWKACIGVELLPELHFMAEAAYAQAGASGGFNGRTLSPCTFLLGDMYQALGQVSVMPSHLMIPPLYLFDRGHVQMAAEHCRAAELRCGVSCKTPALLLSFCTRPSSRPARSPRRIYCSFPARSEPHCPLAAL